MTPEQEKRFKALNVLRKAAWDSFDHRRTYEWKFAFGIWTALAAFTGALLSRPAAEAYPLKGILPFLLTVAFGAFAAAIHFYWSLGINKANAADRKISFVYEREMCPLVSVDRKTDILPIVRELQMGKLTNFSHLSQVGITVLLVVAVCCAMWARTHAVEPQTILGK